MFYSHVHLRKNGRFGLIWLAATGSRVLTRRELHAVNISITCSDILSHVPGHQSSDVYHRPRRFSLYLTSQLMFGSVKIFEKQCGYLLADVTALFRKFHPDVSSCHEIDLIVAKHEPVTLESCVPVNSKDKNFDPFFGAFKDSTTDVETLLEEWDSAFIKNWEMICTQSPILVKPDIGSPHSVSDPREISIQDQDVSAIDPVIPGEQDLPVLDLDNLALIQEDNEKLQLSQEEIMSPGIARILHPEEITLINDLQTRPPSVEETPAVKTSGEMPETPKKPKRPRLHGSPDNRRKKQKIAPDAQTSETNLQVPQVAQTKENEVVGPLSPLLGGPHSHDWLQMQPQLQLTPIPLEPSPVRKRKPHKLIIDETLQMYRSEIKDNMLDSKSTCTSLILPSTDQKDPLKEPASLAMANPVLKKLWRRNCKFGLRIYDTGTESSESAASLSPLDTNLPGQKQSGVGQSKDTPLTGQRRRFEVSPPSSIERGRDASALSASLERGNRSHSLVGQVSDESSINTSAKKQRLSLVSDHEKSGGAILSVTDKELSVSFGVLPSWPEEQEHLVSPVALAPEAVPEQGIDLHHSDDKELESPLQEPAVNTSETVQTQLLRLIKANVSTPDDWTTFQMICPPSSTKKIKAACLFFALCCLAGKQKLAVRQDESYSDIFIWLRDNGDASHK